MAEQEAKKPGTRTEIKQPPVDEKDLLKGKKRNLPKGDGAPGFGGVPGSISPAPKPSL